MKEITIKQGTTSTLLHEDPECTYIIESGATCSLVVFQNDTSPVMTIKVRLVGESAVAKITGVSIPTKENLILRTLQSHEAIKTTSDLFVKSVVFGSSSYAYSGSIRVEKQAQRTDAYQRNENLLLSEDSLASSKPALEILANDVRCTHGATVSSIHPDELWFLESRGIPPESAKQMVVGGFIHSLFERVSDTILVSQLEEKIWQSIPSFVR
ncbi:SufD family Fe-S cluster assembly protein [Candidatus Gottesmanbacteria bacterium]|nr:SufD family Fe-S cluster assembly protein [Candidatus Gottesmanbacteria bacterium]